ncbi:hypothetical protein SAY86_014661 [Trapa natans]|uniref:BSD domain-containing protein n=1 Tax=Trapa natans TaxID=22666 RepID=A0AAN7QJK3_TRANT|nr:hypothetical protein SAY86_014661 [Trapa natans]
MDFFKSVFSEDSLHSMPDSPLATESPDTPSGPPTPDASSTQGAWSFGGLIQTLATKSESVIQNYRRDLEDLGSGLRKETELIREAASRAVKDLPASLEVGASVAQESLESVGQAIDDIGATVWKSTAEIISHSKEAFLAHDSDSSDYTSGSDIKISSSQLHGYGSRGLDVKKYSRFEAQLRAIQSDVGTYCDEPDDVVEYREWETGFVLVEKNEEIETLVQENGDIGVIYGKVVPGTVDHETFWGRYFYRVHKLKQAEDARARLVKRAISGEEDEDLRWDFDDDDDDDEEEEGSASNPRIGNPESVAEGSTQVMDDKKEQNGGSVGAEENDLEESNHNKSEGNIEEKENVESGESCKESDVSIISSQPSVPEDDLGWDEIEDIIRNDEIKGDTNSSSASRADLRKRLGAAADEDENLNWDIDGDQEPPEAK